MELDDGKIYRKALYLMVKTMVSCRFSLKPIQWFSGSGWFGANLETSASAQSCSAAGMQHNNPSFDIYPWYHSSSYSTIICIYIYICTYITHTHIYIYTHNIYIYMLPPKVYLCVFFGFLSGVDIWGDMVCDPSPMFQWIVGKDIVLVLSFKSKIPQRLLSKS